MALLYILTYHESAQEHESHIERLNKQRRNESEIARRGKHRQFSEHIKAWDYIQAFTWIYKESASHGAQMFHFWIP